MTKLLVLDNNCLNQLCSAAKRDRLAHTIHDEGWELWPTGSNVLEAVSAADSDGLLSALHTLAGDNHAFPMPTGVLEEVARSRAEDAGTISIGEGRFTHLLRNPSETTPDLLAEIRKHIREQEARFDRTYERAREVLRDRLLADGGRDRWPTVRAFLDEVWSRPEHLGHYVQLWRLWGLPEPVPVGDLLCHPAWSLYLESWGAALYARIIQHPQQPLVESSDLEQLAYLGMAPVATFVTEDKGLQILGTSMLDGRYPNKRVVPLDAVLQAA